MLRLEDEVNSVGNVHGERLVLFPKESVWSELRPENAAGVTEEKLLLARLASVREERLAREGRVPERALFWR